MAEEKDIQEEKVDEEELDNQKEPDLDEDDTEEFEEVEPEEVITPEEVAEQDNEEVEKLKSDLAEADKTITELKDRLIRSQADFENFKKRTQKQKEDIAQYTKEELVKKLLPVLDNFDLALNHSSTDNPEAYQKGVELVSKQLRDVLETEGLKEVEAEGKEFNPNYHHGVAVDNNEDVPDQNITEVYQKGYELKGKVIRPAMVKVNQNS